jgi:ArsR family transcriptional regulator
MESADRRLYQLHAELCKTLANPTRLEILTLLRDGEQSVTALTTRIGIHQSTVSQHLAVLRQRRVVVTRKEGANIFYRIANPKMVQACDLIRDVLFDQIAAMKQLTQHVEVR